MSVIWDNEPISSHNLVSACAEKLGWKKSTTYTTLKKLSDKGFANNQDSVITSLIPRDKVQEQASAHFVEHTFGGSLPNFLVSFFGNKTISESEAAQLKALIDSYKEE